MIIANTKHPIVAALPHPDHPTMLVTNAVAALANGWGWLCSKLQCEPH
jgi:hypothetical protein